MKAAGAIPIGRTNLPSGAIRWHCDSELWGATVNPWERTRTPGASSAGEAAAIATGMSPLGLGSDGLGSLRHPAQCCGIAALKPTLGRVPQASAIEPEYAPIGIQLTAVSGPLARRVADLRAAFEVVAGPTWRDPGRCRHRCTGRSCPRRSGWRSSSTRRARARPPRCRRAYARRPRRWRMRVTTSRRSNRRRSRWLRNDAAGHAHHPRHPARVAGAHVAVAPADTNRFMAAFFDAAGHPDVMTAELSFMTRQAVLRAWAEFQEKHPLIVAPICTEPPFGAGTDLDDGQVAETIRDMRMAMAVNALGLPAVAVPVGVGDGLPQAVQVIGPRYREDLCLDAAAAIEERRGTITPIDPR